MSQEDILQSTKTVIQGLDALKNEHGKMLDNIVETMGTSASDKNKMEEKANLLRKSMDMIELGTRDIPIFHSFFFSSVSKVSVKLK